jgi:pyruvate ferredoxin oxidoreductase gamma subunit
MHAVRIHGRGGQGVVTAAELLSIAAFTDGKYFPTLPHHVVVFGGLSADGYLLINSTFTMEGLGIK